MHLVSNSKNPFMNKVPLFLLIIVAFLFGSCSTSKITSVWTPAAVESKAYQKIMVLAIVNEVDRSLREDLEKHLVGDLKELGYNAFSSFIKYGPNAFDRTNEDKIKEKIHSDGVDAVFVIALLDKKRERHYVPNMIFNTPNGRDFYGYYNMTGVRVFAPGYYSVSTRYFWEGNLFNLNTRELIYSAQSRSFDPGSKETLAHEYGKMIVKDMVKRKVLSSQENKVVDIF